MTTPGTECVEYSELPASDLKYDKVMQIIRGSFLDPDYDSYWTVTKIETVKNPRLYDRFRAKREELKRAGRTIAECDMFTCYKNEKTVRDIFKAGLRTARLGSSFLGNNKDGVSLWRHADVELKAAEKANQQQCYLIICKVMLGNALPVHPSATNQLLTPPVNFDSHISGLPVDRSMPLEQQAVRSQVFCYEYINGKLASCPRHVLPYVKVCYRSSSRMISRPVLSDFLLESQIQRSAALPGQRSSPMARAAKLPFECIGENALFAGSDYRSVSRPAHAPGSTRPAVFSAAPVTWSGELIYPETGQCQQASCALNSRGQPPVTETMLAASTEERLGKNVWSASSDMNRPGGVRCPQTCYSGNTTSWHWQVSKPSHNARSQALIPDGPPTDGGEFYSLHDWHPISAPATKGYGSGVFVQLDTTSQIPVASPNANVTSGIMIVEGRSYDSNMKTTIIKQGERPLAEWHEGVRWNSPVFAAASSEKLNAGCTCHEWTPHRSQPPDGVICKELTFSPCQGESCCNQCNHCTDDVCRGPATGLCFTKRPARNLEADQYNDVSLYRLPGTVPSRAAHFVNSNGNAVTPDSVVPSGVALSVSNKTPTRENEAQSLRQDRGHSKGGPKGGKWNKGIPNSSRAYVKASSTLRRPVWQTIGVLRFCQDGGISAYYYKEKKSTITAKPKTRLNSKQLLEYVKDCAYDVEVEIAGDRVIGLHKREDEDFREGGLTPTVNEARGSASFGSEKEDSCCGEAQECDRPNPRTAEAIDRNSFFMPPPHKEDCRLSLTISKVESLRRQMRQDLTSSGVRRITPDSTLNSSEIDLAASVNRAGEESGRRAAVSQLSTKCSFNHDAKTTCFSKGNVRITQQNQSEGRAEAKGSENKIINDKLLGSLSEARVNSRCTSIRGDNLAIITDAKTTHTKLTGSRRTGKNVKLIRPARKIPSAGRFAASKRLSRRYANWRKRWKEDRLRARLQQ